MLHVITDASTVTGWRKSSFSDNSGPNCVELAAHDGRIALRDSKNPAGPALTFTGSEISAFIEAAKAGEFDDLGAA